MQPLPPSIGSIRMQARSPLCGATGMVVSRAIIRDLYARDQISSLTLVNGSPIIFTKTVPATIYGWENDLTYKVTQNDLLKASASFEHSKYGQFMTGIADNVDWTGYSLDKTPHMVLTRSPICSCDRPSSAIQATTWA